MPSVVIDLRSTDDLRDVVHQSVQALAEGKIIAIPTETVYGLAVSAVDAQAVERLLELKNRPDRQPFVLAIKSADDALDYAPGMPPLGRRLARRCWPGPVTMVVEDSHPESLLRRLPLRVQQAVTLDKTVGLRVPAHPTALDIMRLIAGPLALTSANLHGQPDALTAEDVVKAFGDRVPLILNDGPSRLGQPSTVVRISGNCFEVLRKGVVPESTLRRLAAFTIVLVCTGNTCRSPMAEVMTRKLLADRLKCPPESLADQGVVVVSAGISAMSGNRATPEAVEVMAAEGLRLAEHHSQPLTDQLVQQADLVWTMTRSHRQAIVQRWPEAARRTEILSRDHEDINDPIGGPLEYYKQCAGQIKSALVERIADLRW